MQNDYTEENLLKDFLQDKPDYDNQRIREAFSWAYNLHRDQKRKSGEPYIIHPISVAKKVMGLGLDDEAVIAALLHDVIEDCGVKYDEVKEKFGEVAANLVLSETKVDELTSSSHVKFKDYENLKRMLFAMTDDVRVILIRLADRLHNMETVAFLSPERRISYSKETLNFYVPIAEYLNIENWKRQLEDIAFKNINPEEYSIVENLLQQDPRSNPENIASIQNIIEELMKKHRIKCEVYGRIKGLYSINKKIKSYLNRGKIKEYTTKDIFDLLAFRIITEKNNVIECYKVLGAIHSNFEHLPEEFDDYISNPKSNGYKSIQTDVIINKLVTEIQIRTKKMHEHNEFGDASHISYKKGDSAKKNESYEWVKNLMKWKGEKKDFSIKRVFSDKVYVFTPTGELIELPKGANSIDFAYRIHTKVGNSCIGAKVDGKIVPVTTKLKTGEIIEIITDKNKKIPNEDWEKIVLPKTASIIRHELSKLDRERQIERGKEMFKQKLSALEVKLDEKDYHKLFNEFAAGNEEEFYRKVYFRLMNISKILKLAGLRKSSERALITPKFDPNKKYIIEIDGKRKLKHYIAKCCSPVPVEKIIGFVSLEHGVTIHKIDCPLLSDLDQKKLVSAQWTEE